MTAKLRDAVKIHLMKDGKDRKMYKNIDFPDPLKELEIKDFKFLLEGDKIEFQLFFDKGILPATFPDNRPKVTRMEKAIQKEYVAKLSAKAAPSDSKPEAKAATPAPTAKPEAKAATPAPVAKPEAKAATSIA